MLLQVAGVHEKMVVPDLAPIMPSICISPIILLPAQAVEPVLVERSTSPAGSLLALHCALNL
jgi:hypothetical protein